MLTERIKNIIINEKLIEENDHIILGVSGGHDSIVMLDILHKISTELNFHIYIAHVNHGTREESHADEQFIKELSKSLDIPFFSTQVDMNRYAKENKISPEESGRILRYKFFYDILKKRNIKSGKIAVAHNKNDQAETLIMRFMRGTGIDGLRGMIHKDRNIIRPLLSIPREDIEKHWKVNKLGVRIDKTNYETIYSRNKVRLELIPYIEKNFNSNIIDTLVRMSDTMKVDLDYLIETSNRYLSEVVVEETEDSIVIDETKFQAIDIAMKYRVLRLAIEKVKKDLNGITKKHLDNILRLSEKSQTGKLINIIGNIIVRKNYDKIVIEKSGKNIKIRYNYKIGKIEKKIDIKEIGKEIIFKIVSVEEYNKLKDLKDMKNKAGFDYNKIAEYMIIRTREPGDKIRLEGVNGRKKIKDYFIDIKLPPDERDRTPLLIINGQVAWIIGNRKGQVAEIDDSTTQVVLLEYK